MKETTERKITRKPKAETTTTPTDFKEQFVASVADDLTPNIEKEQAEALKWVKSQFSEFRNDVFQTIESSRIPERLALTDEFIAYKFSVRKAERWAKAAIINDWDPDFVFTPTPAIAPYSVELDITALEQERVCHQLSKYVFELGVRLATVLPDGRALGCFATEVQVLRGWLMDAVMENAYKGDKRKPKTHFNAGKIQP